MRNVWFNLFVRKFYADNAGFFLTVIFVFFGSVQGGTLIAYHRSLMQSLLFSNYTLSGVCVLWILYAAKCVNFFLRSINAPTGNFLVASQALSVTRQTLLYCALFSMTYAPVFLYSVAFAAFAITEADIFKAMLVMVVQLLIVIASTAVIFRRLNGWLNKPHFRLTWWRFPKPLLTLFVWHVLLQRRLPLLVIKAISLALLYAAFVVNNDHYSPDSFALFYLLILLLHVPAANWVVVFAEGEGKFLRQLPLTIFQRQLMLVMVYSILVLPELVYMLYHATVFPIALRLSYYVNCSSFLFVLTAVQYTEQAEENDFLKAAFGLFFVSVFAVHTQTLWWWAVVQLAIGLVLFQSGFYTYQPATKQKKGKHLENKKR